MIGCVIRMQHTNARLLIDQQPCRDSLGLEKLTNFLRRKSKEALNKSMEGTARRAREGDRIMRIENHEENVFQNIARENFNPPPAQINIAFLPSAPPKITYVPGELNIEYVGNNFDRKG